MLNDTIILNLIFPITLLMEALKYMGAELVANKGDECMAYSWDSACIRRMEWAWMWLHNVQHAESLASESSSWISTFDALRWIFINIRLVQWIMHFQTFCNTLYYVSYNNTTWYNIWETILIYYYMFFILHVIRS